jgi:hypothetical protein
MCTLAVILVLWISVAFFFLGYGLYDTVIGGLGMAIFLPLIYLLKRKSAYLSSLVQKYAKQEGRKDLNMIAVQTAYGRYRLAFITFKLELKNDPENKTLQEIVSLMEDLESGNKFFT